MKSTDEGAGQGARPRARPLDAGGAGARAGPERRADQGREDRHLRHRHPHLELGRLGGRQTVPVPMVVGHEFVGRIADIGAAVTRLQGRRARVRRGPHRLRHLPQLPRRALPLCRNTSGVGVNRPGRFRRVSLRSRASTSCRCRTTSPTRWRRSSTRSATRCIPRSASICVGEDVLVTGAGPIGIMGGAGRQARRRAPRGDHRHQPDTGWSSRGEMGVDVRRRCVAGGPRGRHAALGMREGFDVGLEMSARRRPSAT